MNFSMYSCSHFGNVLSDAPDSIGIQNALSKRGHNTTSNEGFPKAKAKPCLVLREREQRSEEISSQSLGSRVNPGSPDERNEVVRATRQLVLPTQIQKSAILKRLDERILFKPAGNWGWRTKTKQKVMSENILTPRAQGNLQLHHQN